MSGQGHLQSAYQDANVELRRRNTTIGYAVALILVPAGFVLDYFYYPQFFEKLVLVRASCFVVLLILYAMSHKQFSYVALWVTGMLWPTLITVSICVMIYLTEGIYSPYYAGLNLVLIGAALILPLTLKESMFILVTTLFIYMSFLYMAPNGNLLDNPKILFNNIYFIVLTGIIGSVASFFNEKSRFNQFSLQYELDIRNKELFELDRVKSDFFANMSHELRTPLTLILSPIQDLLSSDQPLDFKVSRALGIVQDNAFRLLKLVNDLLSIIKLDEQESELKRVPVPISNIVRSVVKSMQHMAEKQKIQLNTDFQLDTSYISGNASALEKIVINVLSNAIKFTPARGEINVSSVVSDNEVTFTFADTGIGISQDELANVFDRFRQADSSITRNYQGTGLGLALVKELTQAQEGKVEINSIVNEGTKISISFPVIKLSEVDKKEITTYQDDSANHQSPLEKIHQAADYSLQLNIPDAQVIESPTIEGNINASELSLARKPSLLIVDDEPDLRSYMVNTFSDSYEILSTADGELGLAMAKKHRPDLIILDLMLPKMDGLQVCSAIKADDDLKFSKVMLLTARIDEKSKLTALRNGADDFLTKPFSTVEVKTRLANLWESAQLEHGLNRQNSQLEQALIGLKALESKLIHSEKINAIGSMASGLLHEVNNPLNYAITAMQMLKREPDVENNEELKELTEDAFEGMERIRAIVQDLHAFAYPSEADKQERFSLRKAVENAMRFTSGETKAIEVDVQIDDEVYVMGSYNHIVQVLVNLITNASKALVSVDNPKITISSKEIYRKTDGEIEERMQIIVRDNGVGISTEVVPRIFEPFYTTRDVGEGLGMGLSICHTIISNHKGELSVNSEVDQFAEFSFDLPLSIT